LGSGLGSSDVATVNAIFGGPLSPVDLANVGLGSEAKVARYHAAGLDEAGISN